MNRKTVLTLILLVLLAAALRLYNPTFRSLWGDEAHSFYMARQITPANIVTVTSKLVIDSHLPLYFIALSGWAKIFGPGEYALRALSVVISLFGLLAFWLFLRRLFEEKTALLGMLLLAFSPLAVMQAQEIRMYGLLFALSIYSAYCFWSLVSGRNNALSYLGFCLATILLLFTHVYGFLIISAQVVYLAIVFFRERKGAIVWPILTFLFLLAVLLAPIYLRMVLLYLQYARVGAQDMAFSVFPWYLKGPLIIFVLSLGETVAPWDWPVVLPAGAVFAYLFLMACRSWRDKRIAFLLIMMLVPILIAALFLPPTMPKYLIISLPFYLAMIAYALTGVKKTSWRSTLVIILLAVQLIALSNYFSLRDYHNSNQLEPWRQVSAVIKSEYRPGDVILGTTHFVVYNLLDYYLNVAGQNRVPIYDLEEQIIDIGAVKPKRIWLVTNIHDDRAFPPGVISGVMNSIGRRYRLVRELKYLPYEETLVSRLPIKRHKAGSNRIELRLFDQKRL